MKILKILSRNFSHFGGMVVSKQNQSFLRKYKPKTPLVLILERMIRLAL
jgi:hypothetical protein